MGVFDFLHKPKVDSSDLLDTRADHSQEPAPTGAGPVPAKKTGFGDTMQFLGDVGRGVWQEGFGSFFKDADGVMARQAAQRELAPNFDVVSDKTGLDLQGAPNRVTESQFHDIAKQYAKLTGGQGNLHDNLDGSPEDYAQRDHDLNGQLGRIMQTGSGRRLLDGIGNSPMADANNALGGVRMVPNMDAAGKKVTDNASSEALDPAAAEDPHHGSAVKLAFNPEVEHYDVGREPWANIRSDVVMFHEMTHAYHQMHGTYDSSAVAEPGLGGSMKDSQSQIERGEHQAVGLGAYQYDKFNLPTENSYRAERAMIGAHARRGVVDGDVDMPLRTNYVTEGPAKP